MKNISFLTEILLYEKIKEAQPYSWFLSSSALIKLMIEEAQIIPSLYALELTEGDGL